LRVEIFYYLAAISIDTILKLFGNVRGQLNITFVGYTRVTIENIVPFGSTTINVQITSPEQDDFSHRNVKYNVGQRCTTCSRM